MKIDQETLLRIEQQLSHPEGESGILIGDNMYESNFGMIGHAICELELENNQSILEIGHGNCKHLPLILKQTKNVLFYGLEISKTMKNEAEQNNAGYVASGQAEFKLYDGEMIPHPQNRFDKIMTVNTVYFWTKPVSLLKEIYRVLKPEGTVIIAFAEKSFMQNLPFVQSKFKLYDKEAINQLVNQTSFNIDSYHTYTEQVRSKTGDMVEREFSVVNLQK